MGGEDVLDPCAHGAATESIGLRTPAATSATCRYAAVDDSDEWPISDFMVMMSTPSSSRCVAKLALSAWNERPAFSTPAPRIAESRARRASPALAAARPPGPGNIQPPSLLGRCALQ